MYATLEDTDNWIETTAGECRSILYYSQPDLAYACDGKQSKAPGKGTVTAEERLYEEIADDIQAGERPKLE